MTWFFCSHISHHFEQSHQDKILEVVSDAQALSKLPVSKFTDLFVKA
jgi:2-methylcitrate dehydratase